MRKLQVYGRFGETVSKLNGMDGKLVGNKAMEPVGAHKNGRKDQPISGNESAKAPWATNVCEAVDILRADQKIVRELFDEYEKIDLRSRKDSLVSRICTDLTIHVRVEEEVFYPALNAVIKDKRLISKAILEHVTLQCLIAEVEGVEQCCKKLDAKINLLSECVKYHVKEDEITMFPRATATNLNMMELGARVASRKEELIAERLRCA